jgi:hypothetical protein
LPLITADAPEAPIAQVNEDEPGQQPQQPELRSFLQVLVDDICSDRSELPVQIKCNACVLLLKVVESARSGKILFLNCVVFFLKKTNTNSSW